MCGSVSLVSGCSIVIALKTNTDISSCSTRTKSERKFGTRRRLREKVKTESALKYLSIKFSYTGLSEVRWARRSPIFIISTTIIIYSRKRAQEDSYRIVVKHSIVFTCLLSRRTPWRVMTLGCLNWPMMAASCRN